MNYLQSINAVHSQISSNIGSHYLEGALGTLLAIINKLWGKSCDPKFLVLSLPHSWQDWRDLSVVNGQNVYGDSTCFESNC